MTKGPKKSSNRRNSKSSNDKVPAAYFLSLEVENVLCFKDRQVLDLTDKNGNPAQWTVILGNNGVGKTTLLRCLAGLEVVSIEAEKNFSFFYPSHFSYWQHFDFLKAGRESKILAALICNKKLSFFNSKNKSKNHSSKPLEVKVEISYNIGVKYAEPLKKLLCYGYGASRMMGETSLQRNRENSESLFSEKTPLINAEEWLLQTDYSARSASGKVKEKFERQLAQIIEVLKRILPDIEEIRIAPADEENPRPRAEFLTPYGWVQLSGLGLGYRTMIAWMVDLAVRLFRRYPDSPDPLAEPAIVLVDEIDLHLHPKWQRTIMSFLTERFPNTQFIVTAHSPLVVQAAQDANIVLLRREGDRVVIDNDPEIIENWRVDQVLTSVFEMETARPEKIEPLLRRRREILAQPHLSEADEAELQELTQQIGSIPTGETPEDIKAMDIIRRAAKLLENP